MHQDQAMRALRVDSSEAEAARTPSGDTMTQSNGQHHCGSPQRQQPQVHTLVPGQEAGDGLPTELTSVTAALDTIGFGWWQAGMVCYCGLAWLADACEVMLLSYLGPALRCDWGLSPSAESTLTSVVFAGMLVGVYSLGAISDSLGRRRGFLLSALLLGAAGLASAAAPSFTVLLLLRGVVGVGLGGTPVAVTLSAEFLPSHSRGRWLLFMQLWWTFGTMFEACLAWGVLGPLGWRWLLALSAAPLFVLLMAYPLLPESPQWLTARGQYEAAEAVVRRVAAVNGYSRPLHLRLRPSQGSPQGQQEHEQGQQQQQRVPPGSPSPATPLLPSTRGGLNGSSSSSSKPRPALDPGQGESGQGAGTPKQQIQAALKDMGQALRQLFGPQLRRTTLLLYVVWFANALTYYGLVLLTTALQTATKREPCKPEGGPNLESSDYLAILITSAAEAPGLLVAASLIDTRGRKWTLRAGLLVCGASLLLLLAAAGPAHRWLSLLLLFVARGGIEGTFSVLYVYSPELYPTIIRTFGLALCNACSRLGGFLSPYATVQLVEGGHAAAAEVLLGCVCLVAAAAAFFLPYETRGRDLANLEFSSSDGQAWHAYGRRRQGAASQTAGGRLGITSGSSSLEDGWDPGADLEGAEAATTAAADEQGRAGDQQPLLLPEQRLSASVAPAAGSVRGRRQPSLPTMQ